MVQVVDGCEGWDRDKEKLMRIKRFGIANIKFMEERGSNVPL